MPQPVTSKLATVAMIMDNWTRSENSALRAEAMFWEEKASQFKLQADHYSRVAADQTRRIAALVTNADVLAERLDGLHEYCTMLERRNARMEAALLDCQCTDRPSDLEESPEETSLRLGHADMRMIIDLTADEELD